MREQRAPQSLDYDLESFEDALQQASGIVVRFFERLHKSRITPAKNRLEIASLFDEAIPDERKRMEFIY